MINVMIMFLILLIFHFLMAMSFDVPLMVYLYLNLFDLSEHLRMLLTSMVFFSSGLQCWYFSLEPFSLFHHSVLVDLSVSMMMHCRS